MAQKTEIVEMPDELQFGPETQNTHGVPQRAWRKWNNQSRYVFNEMWNQFEAMQSIQHPGAPEMSEEHWATIRWNAAWLAADTVMETVTVREAVKP